MLKKKNTEGKGTTPTPVKIIYQKEGLEPFDTLTPGRKRRIMSIKWLEST